MVWAFLASVGFIGYTYALYPALVLFLARWSQRSPAAELAVPPPTTVIIPAFNEQEIIARKIENVLASDYPPTLLRIVVVSDGSTDNTAARARAVGAERVEVIERADRGGKIAAINCAMQTITDPVVVLTDAGEMFDTAAIRRLVERLADPAVGAVSGELDLIPAESGFSRNLAMYWRYETAIRSAESEIGSVMGVTGAIYALRRECFVPLPADTILDDVAIPFEIIRQGYRVKYEPRAQAYEHATVDAQGEFERKRRTLAGNYQLIVRYTDLLNPLRSSVAIQLWSHKVFRLLVPYALIVAFIASWYLPAAWRTPILMLQAGFYGLALMVPILGSRLRTRLVSLPYAFCALNCAAVAGFFYYLSGRQTAKWEKVK